MGREPGCGSLVFPLMLVIVGSASCGDTERALGRDDVTGLPAGNATGTTFSGSYLNDAGSITGCHCRVGSCAQITANPGGVTTVVQQDGRLTMTGPNGELSVGGINDDGTFKVGGAFEQPGATVYSRSEGKFVLLNGQPDSADFTGVSTDIINMPGLNFDCDIEGQGTLRYQGP